MTNMDPFGFTERRQYFTREKIDTNTWENTKKTWWYHQKGTQWEWVGNWSNVMWTPWKVETNELNSLWLLPSVLPSFLPLFLLPSFLPLFPLPSFFPFFLLWNGFRISTSRNKINLHSTPTPSTWNKNLIMTNMEMSLSTISSLLIWLFLSHFHL